MGELWISTWLDCHEPKGVLAEVRDEGQTALIGIFAVRKGLAFLNQSGYPDRDQIWIEYNGLVGREELQAPALIDATLALFRERHAAEVHLSMLPRDLGEALLGALPKARIYQQVTGWERDLAELRRQGMSVLDALSANTRYQIRRSIRGYEQRYGPLRVSGASTLAEAMDIWRAAGAWHTNRWPDSGFANPSFLTFHETLLKRGFDHGAVRLFRVTSGATTIAALYFLLDGGNARFYLQGVKPEPDGKLKPGLTAHCLLMQKLLDEGWDSYDFMGGDSQYKRQLADRRREFLSLRVHNGSLRHRISDVARLIRDRFMPGTDA
ncbi:MAG: GNAT family N-acetyltransferase [Pseudomonadota bacterium]